MRSPIGSCLRCRHSGFDAYSDGDVTIFGCRTCGSRWKIALGWVSELPNTSDEHEGCPPTDA